MTEFIAKIGYTLVWAFSIPKYSLEEAFGKYYTVGLILFISGIICITILPILIILYKRTEREKMTKELEALEKELNLLQQQKDNLLHKQARAKTDNEIKYWQFRIDKFNEKISAFINIKQRLEAIENAKPSEALERFDYIGNDIKFAYDDDYVSYDYTDDVEYVKKALIKAQEQERKLDRVEGLTLLLFSKRKKIGQEYIKWCEENNAKFDDETNMATWFLSIKLKEVLCDESK